ncbi:MAG TPA: hypothetical protein VIY47_01855, partial [Ignavibacteriaceae bacterium]
MSAQLAIEEFNRKFSSFIEENAALISVMKNEVKEGQHVFAGPETFSQFYFDSVNILRKNLKTTAEAIAEKNLDPEETKKQIQNWLETAPVLRDPVPFFLC